MLTDGAALLKSTIETSDSIELENARTFHKICEQKMCSVVVECKMLQSSCEAMSQSGFCLPHYAYIVSSFAVACYGGFDASVRNVRKKKTHGGAAIVNAFYSSTGNAPNCT